MYVSQTEGSDTTSYQYTDPNAATIAPVIFWIKGTNRAVILIKHNIIVNFCYYKDYWTPTSTLSDTGAKLFNDNDLRSSLAYFMTPSHNWQIAYKTLVAKQLPTHTHAHTYTPVLYH